MRQSRWMSLLCAAAVAIPVVLAGSGAAEAGYYRRRGGAYGSAHVGVAFWPAGLYFGAGLVGVKILDQSGGSEVLKDGGGLTLYSGLRVNQMLALELGWTGTLHNPERVQTWFGSDVDYLVLNAFTADAKVYLGGDRGAAPSNDPNAPPPPPQMEPYLQGGLGVYLLDSDYFGTQSVGTGFQLGGGLDFHVGPMVDLGLRALYRGMAMGPPEQSYNDTFVSAVSVEGNITLFF